MREPTIFEHLGGADAVLLVSRAPLKDIRRCQKRMGWTIPWFSSANNDFNDDLV